MKQLLIIRHAKSSWGSPLLADFDRPLNERGHRDAPVMAKRMLDRGIAIDAFVSSTALRAFTTAAYFAEAYGLGKKNIIAVPELYHASVPVFYDTIRGIDESVATAAVFSHNPGISSFVNELTEARIDDMPTCAVFGLRFHGEWKDFRGAEKEFWFFDYPKQLPGK